MLDPTTRVGGSTGGCNNNIGRAYSRQKRFAEAFIALPRTPVARPIVQKVVEADLNNIGTLARWPPVAPTTVGPRPAGHADRSRHRWRQAVELWGQGPTPEHRVTGRQFASCRRAGGAGRGREVRRDDGRGQDVRRPFCRRPRRDASSSRSAGATQRIMMQRCRPPARPQPSRLPETVRGGGGEGREVAAS